MSAAWQFLSEAPRDLADVRCGLRTGSIAKCGSRLCRFLQAVGIARRNCYCTGVDGHHDTIARAKISAIHQETRAHAPITPSQKSESISEHRSTGWWVGVVGFYPRSSQKVNSIATPGILAEQGFPRLRPLRPLLSSMICPTGAGARPAPTL